MKSLGIKKTKNPQRAGKPGGRNYRDSERGGQIPSELQRPREGPVTQRGTETREVTESERRGEDGDAGWLGSRCASGQGQRHRMGARGRAGAVV